MVKKRVLLALASGVGLAFGRLIIDLLVEPKPIQSAVLYAAISFGVGFLTPLSLFAIGQIFRRHKEESQNG